MELCLDQYIRSFDEISKQGKALSNQNLMSLSRFYISMHNYVVVNALDNIYGDRFVYFEHIRNLFLICINRFKKEKIFFERCKLLYTMFLLADEPFAPDSCLFYDCCDLAGKFMNQSLALHRRKSSEELLLCMVYWIYYSGDTTFDKSFFEDNIDAWIYDLGNKGYWNGLAALKALFRIEILNANACMFMDDRYNNFITSAYGYYSRNIKISITNEIGKLLVLGKLYDQASDGCVYAVDKLTKSKIIYTMSHSAKVSQKYSEEWIYMISYLTLYYCETYKNC